MPLTEFVRYLNAQHPLPKSGLRPTAPFVSEGGHVFVHYANLRLESCFSPIVDTSTAKLQGHAAGLHAIVLKNHEPFDPLAVFDLPGDDGEFIYLDRLVRTLHALNYLTYLNRHSRGTLLLKVHPRHVASVVADHGLAFEDALRACGLLPTQITLEIEIDGVEDSAHLVRAIANYKSRGYGIAVGRFGQREIDLALLEKIRPTIVKFDHVLLASAHPLPPLVDRVHKLGARVMIEGADSTALHIDAQESGFDLLQAHPPLRRQWTSSTVSTGVTQGAQGLTNEAA